MEILRVENASVNVTDENGSVDILKDICLSFESKKIYVITGPNGSGKSTFAKYLMGIMPSSGGKITLDGEEITNLAIDQRSRKGIGFAFQNPPKFKGIKVKNLLELAKKNDTNVSEESELRRCERLALKNVGLCPDTYLDRGIDNTFSGGELKRIELASVLIRDLKVAIFDEPEAGIDLWSFKRMTKTFRNLNKDTDTCIIIISHQERILALADEVIVIDEGKVKEVTTNEKFISGILDDGCGHCRTCDLGGIK